MRFRSGLCLMRGVRESGVFLFLSRGRNKQSAGENDGNRKSCRAYRSEATFFDGFYRLHRLFARNAAEEEREPAAGSGVAVGIERQNVAVIKIRVSPLERDREIAFTDTETMLLRHLSENKEITLQEFQELAHINKRKAEAILADFILVGTIILVQTSQNTVFRLVEDPENE